MGWRQRAAVLAAALWWGSLGVIGFMAVPLLFAHLPTPALAGQTAARLFSAQAWVSVGCGIVLLLASRDKGRAPRLDWSGGALAFVLAGLLLALLLEFAVAPRILSRVDLRLWHTAGSAMYVLQWVCALVVLLRVTGKASAEAGHPRAGGDPAQRACGAAEGGRPGFPPSRE